MTMRPGMEEYVPQKVEFRAEVVIRFGATPTSKLLTTLLGEVGPVQIVVDGDRGWSEPANIPTTFIHADANATAILLADELVATGVVAGGRRPRTRWATDWSDADHRADRALLDWLSGSPEAA